MKTSRGALAGLGLACTLALWSLGRPRERGPRRLDCEVAAQVVDRGASQLLCGAEVGARGLYAGERQLEDESVDRMRPELIEWLALPVDVNSASPAELATLPGIGPKLAARIVDGRPYASLAELDDVRGIGPRKLEALRPRARLSSPRNR